MEIKKTVKEDVLPSCLQATSDQLFIKSPVEELIMMWRLPISLTTSFLILSHPKQLGMHSNKMTFVLLSRGNALFSRRPTEWSISNLPDTMKTGQWRITYWILFREYLPTQACYSFKSWSRQPHYTAREGP